jgi:hypothetical protein
MWRIKVEAKDGTFKHFKTQDQIQSGDLVLSLNPGLLIVDGRAYWSLRDARFQAIPASVGIKLHDWVEFQVKASDYTFWAPAGVGLKFDETGEFVILGRGEALNAGDLNNDYLRISFTPTPAETRLVKTYIPTPEYPQQEAAWTFRQAVQDVLSSGQVGSAVRYDPGFLPTTEVILGKRTTNVESLSSLMTTLGGQVAQQKTLDGDSREWKWGCAQTGHVFMGPMDHRKLTLDEREEGIGIEFLGMQGADTCEAVIWQVQLPNGTLPLEVIHTYPSGDTTVLQFVSVSTGLDRFVGVNSYQPPGHFHHLSKQNPLDTAVQTVARSTSWKDARFMERPNAASAFGAFTNHAQAVDGDPSTFAAVGPVGQLDFGLAFDSEDLSPVQVSLTYSANRDWTDGQISGGDAYGYVRIKLQSLLGGESVNFEWALPKTPDLTTAITRDFVVLTDRTTSLDFNLWTIEVHALPGTTVRIWDVQFQYVSLTAVDGLSREHWVTPVENAGEATVSGKLALPVAYMDLVKEDGSTLPDIPVELVEWTLGGSELKTVFKFGEIDPRRAQVLANEALRKQKTETTGTSAVVTATGGGD